MDGEKEELGKGREMKNPYIDGCPVCRILPVRDWNDRRAPVVVDHLGIGRVVVCNHCGVCFVISNEAMKSEEEEREGKR